MSIYCSFFDFDDDLPTEYKGSHVMPSRKAKRSGYFGISAIPNHVRRNGKDKPDPDGWHPWLRVHLHEGYQESILLSKRQAKKLRDALDKWIENS
jgi:hypothetical protein